MKLNLRSLASGVCVVACAAAFAGNAAADMRGANLPEKSSVRLPSSPSIDIHYGKGEEGLPLPKGVTFDIDALGIVDTIHAPVDFSRFKFASEVFSLGNGLKCKGEFVAGIDWQSFAVTPRGWSASCSQGATTFTASGKFFGDGVPDYAKIEHLFNFSPTSWLEVGSWYRPDGDEVGASAEYFYRNGGHWLRLAGDIEYDGKDESFDYSLMGHISWDIR